jgi:hypothetical protein
VAANSNCMLTANGGYQKKAISGGRQMWREAAGCNIGIGIGIGIYLLDRVSLIIITLLILYKEEVNLASVFTPCNCKPIVDRSFWIRHQLFLRLLYFN